MTQEQQGPMIRVLGFHQTYERLPVKGDPFKDNVDDRGFMVDDRGRRVLKNVEVDWVTYAPSHSPLNTSTSERIRHLEPSKELLNGEGGDNGEKAAFMQARWNVIEPAHAAWKQGQELPLNGTPLAHWPGVSAAAADVLRQHGLRTVEEVRDLTENQLDRVRLPNMRDLRQSAKAFLENSKSAEAAEREVERDKRIEELEERLAAAMELLEAQTMPADPVDDLEQLRARLDAKGVKYHHKAGAETLRALLAGEAA